MIHGPCVHINIRLNINSGRGCVLLAPLVLVPAIATGKVIVRGTTKH